MILLMPCELELKSSGRVWGVIRAEVSENGEVVSIAIKPSSDPHWKPFCTITTVEQPELGMQLAYRLHGGATQRGEIDGAGNITRTA
jgi:hypothetical protein